MNTNKRRTKFGKKAFIAGAIVDVWSLIMFVIVIMAFAVLYKWDSVARENQLDDKSDIIYGNYLAQVYLRTPIDVAGEKMSMADLIALYNHNQSLEGAAEEGFASIFRQGRTFFVGSRNPMFNFIEKETEKYVEANFDQSKCYAFAIHGNTFDYNLFGGSCPSGVSFSVHYLLHEMENVPDGVYLTNIATVDPGAEPIILYSVYDIERLLEMYSDDPFFDLEAAQRRSIATLCRMNVWFTLACRSYAAVQVITGE
ncbi:hypothetical protein HQ545_08455 [Candidatus Woesearchaeota archaeon]|nr:hypothetical protein [Candidatus Woesearchaeota archaeon]